jgi:hypothetical protein
MVGFGPQLGSKALPGRFPPVPASLKLVWPRDYSERELKGVIAAIAHLAYHFGAIRRRDRSIRGPLAS